MKTYIVTGSGGLIGRSVSEKLMERGDGVIGIDMNLRAVLLKDPSASNSSNLLALKRSPRYVHQFVNILDEPSLSNVFHSYKNEIKGVIHCAAQTAHEAEMKIDAETNIVGTLNLLELTRVHCPDVPFVFLSTIKVYGDYPNRLAYCYQGERFEMEEAQEEHPDAFLDYAEDGFDESVPFGEGEGSFFGCSKAAADLYVQQAGREFGLETVCFRASCVTGAYHAGTSAHGMLSYMVKCALQKEPYTYFGHEGYQVRDQLHSDDLARAILSYLDRPGDATQLAYNLGGGRENSCSMREAVMLIERETGERMKIDPRGLQRHGDHRWWITDSSAFKRDYPDWAPSKNLAEIIHELVKEGRSRWVS
jgi:CDP-paratose 2-epimerase